MNEDCDFEDMFRPPNDGAYEKEEIRTGPPLDYVSEKLRRSLELTHHLIKSLNKVEGPTQSSLEPMLFESRGALRYQLTSYLALKNMLALGNERGFFERMENHSTEEFRDWLDRIDQQGSVTG